MTGSIGWPARLVGLLLLAGCHADQRPPPLDSLVGVRASLWPSETAGLRLSGGVGAMPADVFVDVAAPVSRVSAGCFEEPLVGAGRVTVVDPLGAAATLPLTKVVGFSLGGGRLRPFAAALGEGKRCNLTLGGAELEGVAIAIDFPGRELRFERARPRPERLAQAAAAHGTFVLELSREPKHDWPLLAARVWQGSASWTGAFVLSTRQLRSQAFEAAPRAAGLRRTEDLVPDAAPALRDQARVRFPGLYAQRLELAPGLGAADLSVRLVEGAAPHGPVGTLGVEAWGQGEVTIDVAAGVVLVRRATPGNDAGLAQVLPADPVLEALHAAVKDAPPLPEVEPQDP